MTSDTSLSKPLVAEEGDAGLTKTEKTVCLDLDVLFTLRGTNTMEKRKDTGRIMALAAGMIVFGTASPSHDPCPSAHDGANRPGESGTLPNSPAPAPTPAPAPAPGQTFPANPAPGQTAPAR